VEEQLMFWHEMQSPVGRLLLAGDGTCVKHIHFQSGRRDMRPGADWVRNPRKLADVVHELEEYFAGKRKRFDVQLGAQGTDFQRVVWRALVAIPYGETVSYGELARRIGHPQASRAVGLANGANPLPIIVPCHRVIGSNGSLTGFGGGLDVKRKLLELEGAACVRDLFQDIA
jgi:methylated-DNA-[protein]-cysteine S-methyltransferase